MDRIAKIRGGLVGIAGLVYTMAPYGAAFDVVLISQPAGTGRSISGPGSPRRITVSFDAVESMYSRMLVGPEACVVVLCSVDVVDVSVAFGIGGTAASGQYDTGRDSDGDGSRDGCQTLHGFSFRAAYPLGNPDGSDAVWNLIDPYSRRPSPNSRPPSPDSHRPSLLELEHVLVGVIAPPKEHHVVHVRRGDDRSQLPRALAQAAEAAGFRKHDDSRLHRLS